MACLEKKDCVGAFNSFGGETGFTSTLCQAKKNVDGGSFPSYFLGAGTESAERVLDTGIGVDHCVRYGNNRARLMMASVSGRIPMWS